MTPQNSLAVILENPQGFSGTQQAARLELLGPGSPLCYGRDDKWKMFVALVIAAALIAAPTLTNAQAMRDTAMPGMAMTPAPSAEQSTAPMPGMNMSATPAMPMSMKGDLGAYPMTRDASGTSWQPDSASMEGLMASLGPWSAMLHGYATAIYDSQGGPRGDDKAFVESMLMGMAQRPLAGGTFTVRGMFSLDPLMGKGGYPLLLATGETADGRTALVDRQHPHDFVMELAGVYSHPIDKQSSGFLYVGWPGEPALGPVTFMHRFSGEANPEAPIDHHWLDSTHITFGVVTAGYVWGPLKLEASDFTGREPNQNRWDLDHPRFDSWSMRTTLNPTRDLSMQVSYGYLKSPEQLEPNVDQRRTTASVTYNLPLRSGNWQSLIAWGRDQNLPGHTLDAYLAETAASFGRHTLFGRAEWAEKDELFDDDPTNLLYRRVFDVAKLSVGYFYTLPIRGGVAADVGGLVSKYDLPSSLTPYYGSDPTSFMLFTRFKLM